jgi:hypothetical protein
MNTYVLLYEEWVMEDSHEFNLIAVSDDCSALQKEMTRLYFESPANKSHNERILKEYQKRRKNARTFDKALEDEYRNNYKPVYPPDTLFIIEVPKL